MPRNPIQFGTKEIQEVYSSKWLSVNIHLIFRGDEPGEYSAVDAGADGSLVLVRDEDYNFLMLNIYRFPTEENIYETPAGAVDDGESPEEAARRELHEEAGIEATSLTHLGSYRMIPGMLDRQAHVYEAVVSHEELVRAKQLDGFTDEIVERQIFSAPQIAEAIRNGTMAGGIEYAAFCLLFSQRPEALSKFVTTEPASLPEPGPKNPTPFAITSRARTYETPWLHINELEISRGGEPGSYSVADRPGDSVAVIVRDDKNNFLVLSVYRFPTQHEGLEFVMGGIDPDEEPAQAAQRELQEETGVENAEINHVLTFYALPALTSMKFHVYEAVIDGKQMEEVVGSDEFTDEIVERKALSLEQLDEAIRAQEMTESVSLGCLALYKLFLH